MDDEDREELEQKVKQMLYRLADQIDEDERNAVLYLANIGELNESTK